METQEAALKALDRDIHALTLDLVAAEKDLERLEGERPRWLDRLEVARFESTTAAAEETESSGELQRIETELATVTAGASRSSKARCARTRKAPAPRPRRWMRSTPRSPAIKVRVAERRQRHEGATRRWPASMRQLAEMASRAAAIAAELDETERERAALHAAVDEAQAQRVAREAQRQAVEVEIAAGARRARSRQRRGGGARPADARGARPARRRPQPVRAVRDHRWRRSGCAPRTWRTACGEVRHRPRRACAEPS